MQKVAPQYRSPERLTHHAAEKVFATGDVNAITEAILQAALYDEDDKWIDYWCRRLSTSDSLSVKGTIAMCYGHLARRFRNLSKKAIVPIIRDIINTPGISGNLSDAVDDLAHFMKWDRKLFEDLLDDKQ